MSERLDGWRQRARALKAEATALALAMRDPRTPWTARLLGMFVVAYALSPIDLIPDFIPVLGLLDDLLLVPLGIAATLRLVPPEVMDDARVRAAQLADRPRSRLGAALVVALWIAAAALVWWVWTQ